MFLPKGHGLHATGNGTGSTGNMKPPTPTRKTKESVSPARAYGLGVIGWGLIFSSPLLLLCVFRSRARIWALRMFLSVGLPILREAARALGLVKASEWDPHARTIEDPVGTRPSYAAPTHTHTRTYTHTRETRGDERKRVHLFEFSPKLWT
jgi:hypothetical protein